MTFILITGSIMCISIFLIYRLCRFFGIEMKWTSLVLCAVMAFIVNGMAITMSPFLDRTHYLRLGILVITAAALVTFFNERMLRRDEALAGGYTILPTEQMPVAEELPVEENILAAQQKNTEAAAAAEDTPTTETPAAPANESSTEKNAANINEAQQAVEEAEATARVIAEKEAAIAAKKAEDEARAKAEKAAKERIAQKKREEEARKRAEAKAAAEAKAKAKAEAEEKARQQAMAAKREAHEKQLKQELSSMDNLDAILDFAYEAKTNQPQDAIFAYQEAISRYADDDYTPFLVIELGNLYKEQANYSGAIATYKKALNMPIIAQNDAMCQEFTKNIHYLGAVQDILAKHAALSTPFPQIPGDIMQEIENEFQAHSDSAK